MISYDEIMEFMAMGGYGAYVWSSFAISFALMIWGIISPVRNLKKIKKDLLKKYQRQELLGKT